MFRVIQFKVDFEKLIAAAEHSRSTVEFINESCEWGRRGDYWVSEPLATTDRRFSDISSSFRGIFGQWEGEGPWHVEDLTENYRLVRTTAPKSYDYGYVIEIGVIPAETERDTARLVAMPRENVEYQTGRYSSGLYISAPCK